jgi:hypothetical protein
MTQDEVAEIAGASASRLLALWDDISLAKPIKAAWEEHVIRWGRSRMGPAGIEPATRRS